MSRLATMGTSSCATIAISGFKDQDLNRNKQYLKNPEAFVEPVNSVDTFYNSILYPTSQPLGKTDEYPFDALMKAIDKSSMKDKFTIITLNEYQYKVQHWLERLEHWGFTLMDKTKNNIGSMNYVFIRNLARPKE